MRIGVPWQANQAERRVGLTTDAVRRLVAAGHEVVVERGAGERAGQTDDAYLAAGGRLVDQPEAWRADLVVTLDPPGPGTAVTGAVLGLLRPFDDAVATERLAGMGITTFAFEAVPRISRAQPMDALSSQATAAGYQAVLEAATASDRFLPMLVTAAGTVRPATVLVLGAGVAGLQAIATAKRLGAVVSAFDVRSAAAEQVASLGATFLDLGFDGQDTAEAGGYAQELDTGEEERIRHGLAPHVAAADVVVATAAVPGKPAPRLVDRGMVESMRPGAVIVDLAASTGGNCEVTREGGRLVHHGVLVIGETDLAGRVAADASRMYARNASAFIELVTGADGAYRPDWDDEIVAESCITRGGAVVHPRLAEAS
jgi:NAD(P) transhydrogenase subunit alpha